MKITRNERYIEKCLQEYNIFNFISSRQIELFGVRYKAGEFIRQPETDRGSKWLQFVISGVLLLYFINDDGNMISEHYGEWHAHIGETEMILNRDCGVFAKAISDVNVLAISVDKYREILLNDKKFLRYALTNQAELCTEKIQMHVENQPLYDRVLNAMIFHCIDGTLKGIELYATIFHCSARQLQRVLNQLESDGKVKKIGKGSYSLCQPLVPLHRLNNS